MNGEVVSTDIGQRYTELSSSNNQNYLIEEMSVADGRVIKKELPMVIYNDGIKPKIIIT